MILLTSFTPFGGAEHNASQKMVEELVRHVGWERLRAVTLPVIYRDAPNHLDQALETYRPTTVIAFGQARSPEIRLEVVARNRDESKSADEAGEIRIGTPVVPGEREALVSRLPNRKLLSRLSKAGFPVRLSHDAGGFLCNHVFFHLMQRAEKTQIPRAGFVHVPETGPQEWGSSALRLILETVISHE